MRRVVISIIALLMFGIAHADSRIAFDPNMGQRVPNIELTDASGDTQSLRAWMDERPTLIAPVYFACPNLCDLTLRGLAGALPSTPAGIRVLAISIDPRENSQTLAQAHQSLMAHSRSDSRWHFLRGDAAAIHALTAALGFKYFYDERQQQFAHAAGVVVLDRSGHVASFFPGVRYASAALQSALSNADRGMFSRVTQHLLLTCFDYDPHTHRYSARVVDVIRIASIATVLVLAVIVGYALRRERHRSRSAGQGP